MRTLGLLASTIAAALLTGCAPAPPAMTAPPSPAQHAPVRVVFATDRLEDAGWARQESPPPYEQFQDARCVVQLLVLPGAGPEDDGANTDVAVAALGEVFGTPEERDDVELPVAGGTLLLPTHRVEAATDDGSVSLQVAVRALTDARVTVAVIYGCYDRAASNEDFDAVIALLELAGVQPDTP